MAGQSFLLCNFNIPLQLFLHLLLFLIFINFDIVADIFGSKRIGYIIFKALIALLHFLNWTFDIFVTGQTTCLTLCSTVKANIFENC